MAADEQDPDTLSADPDLSFRMAFDDAPVGMVIASLRPGHEGEFVEVNGAFARMLGMEPADLVGLHLPEFSHPTDQDRDRVIVSQLARGSRGTYRREKRFRRSDGTYVWARVCVAPVIRDGVPVYGLAHVEDITERRAIEAELARRALYDALTGLPNRMLLVDELRLAVRRTGTSHPLVAVLFLDLDRFKDINDTLGHAAGDEVLQRVARRLTETIAAYPDAVGARLAGDEFIVVSPVADQAAAEHLAQLLHVAIGAPMNIDDRTVVTRASIGIALTSSPADDAEDLLRRADAAMYHAKNRTRRSWAVYDEMLGALTAGRLAIEEDLRTALASDSFRLLYQPIIDLADGRVVGAEALLRLDHPTRGLLAPAAFIDVAEDSDLILPIGAWVLDEATRQLAVWQQRRPHLLVAVNVSARQVRHLVVLDLVTSAAARHGVDPADVHLEITERVLLEGNDDILAELRAVTELGCELAIDDFGTGYSSLAYLTRFPVTALKIDRTFVAGLGVAAESTAVVEAVIGLAEALGLGTVGEGVETAEQLELLRELGCQHAQGYHLGRPMSSDDFEAFLD